MILFNNRNINYKARLVLHIIYVLIPSWTKIKNNKTHFFNIHNILPFNKATFQVF